MQFSQFLFDSEKGIEIYQDEPNMYLLFLLLIYLFFFPWQVWSVTDPFSYILFLQLIDLGKVNAKDLASEIGVSADSLNTVLTVIFQL